MRKIRVVNPMVRALGRARERQRGGQGAWSRISRATSPTKQTLGRICTYNVLSPSLGRPSYFTNCREDDLDPPTRLLRVQKKLQEEVNLGAVICLQEVAREWTGPLHSFFQQNDYHMVESLYGHRQNGHMGIAMAFPSGQYALESVDVRKLTSDYHFPPEPPVSLWIRLVRSANYTIQALFRMRTPRWMKRVFSDAMPYWIKAKKRQNTAIFARLRDRDTNKSFCVTTYHMPCMFRLPKVMVMHTAMLADRARAFAGGDPYVIAGDFNFKPIDECYAFMTEGKLPEDPNGDFAPKDLSNAIEDGGDKGDVPWNQSFDALKSAYADVRGCEPEYTNLAHTRGSKEPFAETLDYIFLSRDIDAINVKTLPCDVKDVERPVSYPTASEPSDHVLIAANIAVQ